MGNNKTNGSENSFPTWKHIFLGDYSNLEVDVAWFCNQQTCDFLSI